MNRFIAAAIQLNSQDNLKKNIEQADKYFHQAVADGAQLVVLPEYSNYLSDNDKMEHAESLDGPTISRFREMARLSDVYFHCGSILEKSEEADRAYNTSVLIDPRGEVTAVYRKIHLFDIDVDGRVAAMESQYIKPGDKAVVVDTELAGRVGLTICYDLRFPELYRTLTLNGAQIIINPAAFTLYTGKDHWEVLLRARAIENEVYMIAPGQFGVHPNNKSCFGNSMIIDPWGTVIARASEGPGYIIAPIELDRVAMVREQIPSLKNRRSFSQG